MIQILLVDDHKIVRDGLRSILQPFTDEIRVAGEAATGKEALDFLDNQARRKEPFTDVVLMDISMPEMNGLDATRTIREHYPSVKVLLLTMLDKEQMIVEASQAGAQGYVLKTAGDKEILHAIRTIFAGEEYFSADVTKLLIHYLRTAGPAPKPRTGIPLPGPAAAQLATTPSIDPSSMDASPLPANITPREREILQLIAQGHTSHDIAERLFTSKRTVETHRQNLLSKTNAGNTAALIRFAVQQGLVD